jgi:putative ABC transport system ATP-binding protein
VYAGVGGKEGRERASTTLQKVGLGDRMMQSPAQLSGGQRPRVAIARALVNEPAIILADETTGNFDSTTSEDIMRLFDKLHDDGQTIIVVTHEHDIAEHAHRVVTLKDGVIASDVRRGAAVAAGAAH